MRNFPQGSSFVLRVFALVALYVVIHFSFPDLVGHLLSATEHSKAQPDVDAVAGH